MHVPDGMLRGHALYPTISPAVDRSLGLLTRLARPWRGKVLDTSGGRGFNLLSPAAAFVARRLWPDTPIAGRFGRSVLALPFSVTTGLDAVSGEKLVLVLDYRPLHKRGPLLPKLRDEIVEVAAGRYVGRAVWIHPTHPNVIAVFALEQFERSPAPAIRRYPRPP